MGIKNKKSLLRLKFKSIRDNISEQEKLNVKKNVERYLKNISLKKKLLGRIGIYWPIQNEVDLRDLKKTYLLALPKCQSKKDMKFYKWDESLLQKDYVGIPSPNNFYPLNHNQISIIFIPCLSIDNQFNRLGYGGGYYDRLRSDKNWEKIPSIGVLPSRCISKDLLICSEFDIPLSGYITDKEIVV